MSEVANRFTRLLAGSTSGRSQGTRLFLWSCVALVVVFFSWASLGRLDVVSSAMGEVVPSSQVKSVQHLEGGIVRAILVREGDTVTEGQTLVELEPTKSGADVDELEIRLAALGVTMARLEAEASGADLSFPDELSAADPDLIRQARDLFLTRRERLENELRVQRELVAQRDQEIKEVRARVRNNRKSLKFLDEQIEISQKLLKLDLTNRMKHLELLKEASDLKGRIEEDGALLPKAQAAQKEAKARLDAIRAAFREDARRDLEEATRSHKELTQRLRKLADSLRRTVLRAPVDGIVKTVHVATRGGVVQPGKTVVDIVPAGDRLVIEARLPTHDIGFVRPGQEAKVRLASAEAGRFDSLTGEVVRVSPDTLLTNEGQPFYKVRIETKESFFERGGLRYDLFPGMQVQCAIRTGSRTVLQYLLDPYVSSLEEAMGER